MRQRQKKMSSLRIFPTELWNVALYCKENMLTAEEWHDLVLDTMGVQAGIRCGWHDLPLIAAPFHSCVLESAALLTRVPLATARNGCHLAAPQMGALLPCVLHTRRCSGLGIP